MSTLCVAAWTPEGGLLIGWMGDTLPFVARARAGRLRRLLLRPSPPQRLTAASTSAWECRRPAETSGAGLVEVEIVGESGAGSRPDAVILASDGAWEPFVYAHGIDWLSDDSPLGGIGAACGPGAETAEDVANRVLAEALRLGLNDNATIAVALWR